MGSDITRMCQHLHEKWLRVGGDSERERTETFSVKAGMDETRMFQYDVKPPLWVPSHLTPKVGSDITRMGQTSPGCVSTSMKSGCGWGGTRKERGLKHTIRFTVHTLYTLHTFYIHFRTLHLTLHFSHFTPHTLRITQDTLHFTLRTLHLHSTLHFALHALHFTPRSPHSTLYTPHSTLYAPHFTLDTPHSTLYTPHSTL